MIREYIPILLQAVVAIGFAVGGENVVIGNDHELARIPDLRVLAELAFENADRPRPANIVRHQHIRIHPDIVARLHACFAHASAVNESCLLAIR